MPQQPISCGKILPGNTGLEHKQNARQTDAIRHTRFADSRHVWMFGQNRLDQTHSASDTNSLLIVSSLTAMRIILTRSFRRDKGHF